MPLEKSRLRLQPLSLLAPHPRAKRSVSAMRLWPHGAGRETRRDLGRLDKLPSTHYISLIASPIDGLSRTGGVVQKPAGTVTLSSAAGEALIAQVRQSNLPPADAGMVEQIIRMYFWLVLALQEAKLSVKRLRTLLFGSSAQPQELSTSGAAATAREPLRPEARGEVP